MKPSKPSRSWMSLGFAALYFFPTPAEASNHLENLACANVSLHTTSLGLHPADRDIPGSIVI